MSAEQTILTTMIKAEMKANKTYRFVFMDHTLESPSKIVLEPDETAFIRWIQVEATKAFTLDFHSATESRKISRTLNNPQTIDYCIITRHKGTIYFNMSTADTYRVVYTIIKKIKI